MSDWFKNPASEIPDEMWRAPAPMQRQADAVVMWAELTGKHASFDGVKAFGQTLRLNPRSDDLENAFAHYEKKTGKRRNQMSQRDVYNSLRATGMGKSAAFKPLWEQQGVKSWAQEDALMAAIKAEATPARKAKLIQRLRKLESSNLEGDYGIKSASLAEMVGHKEAAWKPGVKKAIHMAGDNIELTGAAIGAPLGGLKAYTDYREGKGGISKAEATLKGEITKAQSQKADKKRIAKLRQKLQTAKSRRENIGATTAKGIGLGATTGALGMHAIKRMRGAGPK